MGEGKGQWEGREGKRLSVRGKASAGRQGRKLEEAAFLFLFASKKALCKVSRCAGSSSPSPLPSFLVGGMFWMLGRAGSA